MNIYRYIFILAVLVVFTFPLSAFAHKHIPFYVTYHDGDIGLQLQCEGPWLRDTGLKEISPGTEHK